MPIAINGTAGSITGVTTTISQGGTTSSSAVDITLTNASTQVQYVSMTAVDKFVILPSATTLGKGQAIFTIINTGAFPFHVKDGGGNIIYYNVVANQTLTVTLVDNGAAIGKWATEDGLLQLSVGLPQVSSIDTNSAYVGNSSAVVTMLSATQALIFYPVVASRIDVVLATISGSSVTYGTPVTVASSVTAPMHLKALTFNATTSVLYYYNAAGGESYMRAITVSGSTITVGAQLTLTGTGVNTVASGYMCKLDTTTGFIGFATGQTRALAFTVSGTTITLGAATTLSTTAAEFYSATQIATGKAFVAYMNGSVPTVRACTNSGTTLTFGTALQLIQGTAIGNTQYYGGYEKIATDAVVGTSVSNSFGFTSTAATVSGTTVSSPTNMPSGNGVYSYFTTAKYLSDGLQLGYTAMVGTNAGANVTLLKGGSTVGRNSTATQKLAFWVSNISGQPNMIDVVDGNKGIVVGTVNNLLACQVIGVLY